MSTIIKPCPFCGGSDIDEAFVRSYKSGDQSQPIIAAGCNSCGASGPDTNVPDHSTGYKESINKWNDRAEVERLQARVAELESFINQAPVETGVCMCGEEMYRHGSQPNHTPMDSWDYERDLILRDEAEKAGGES